MDIIIEIEIAYGSPILWIEKGKAKLEILGRHTSFS